MVQTASLTNTDMYYLFVACDSVQSSGYRTKGYERFISSSDEINAYEKLRHHYNTVLYTLRNAPAKKSFTPHPSTVIAKQYEKFWNLGGIKTLLQQHKIKVQDQNSFIKHITTMVQSAGFYPVLDRKGYHFIPDRIIVKQISKSIEHKLIWLSALINHQLSFGHHRFSDEHEGESSAISTEWEDLASLGIITLAGPVLARKKEVLEAYAAISCRPLFFLDEYNESQTELCTILYASMQEESEPLAIRSFLLTAVTTPWSLIFIKNFHDHPKDEQLFIRALLDKKNKFFLNGSEHRLAEGALLFQSHISNSREMEQELIHMIDGVSNIMYF